MPFSFRRDASRQGEQLPAVLAEPYGYFHGPMAHAFACGAQMAVNNEAPWNTIVKSCSCCGPEQKRNMLRESWGVTNVEEWRRTLERLLDDTSSDDAATLLLGMRRQLAHQYGGPVDAGTWRSAIERWCTHNNRGGDVYQRLLGVAGMILDYEKRMTADGVLPPGAFVTHMIGYDFGRAVNMARWGVHAEFTDPRIAEWYVMRAGEQCLRYFTSWLDLSTSYLMGRVLRFDEGEYGPYYTDTVAAHHALMTNPQSPWLNVPWTM
ncbi:DUF1266 domain-containing protein [Marinactinospora rubrisoli]|uniref:DUF1266 domain-containing protein n=1 Tax=Marinactinospora rubrisoli TaxID=2715399 RepID=A0ABW2KE39_9ACTN